MSRCNPIDLSVRKNIPIPSSPIPSFSKPTHQTGSETLTAPGTVDLFNPNCACTVQRLTVQILGDASIQLLENNVPVSPLFTFPSGTVISFPGMLLANNCKLQLLLSTGISFTFDAVWLKDFHPSLIEKALTISQG